MKSSVQLHAIHVQTEFGFLELGTPGNLSQEHYIFSQMYASGKNSAFEVFLLGALKRIKTSNTVTIFIVLNRTLFS